MNKLILANLLHRPLRSIISTFAIAIEVVMILSVVAIFMGQVDGQKIRTNGIGADIIVRPANSSFMTGVSGAPISAKLVEAFRKLPHIAVASPVIQSFNLAGAPEILYGIDYESYNALRPFVFLAGGPFTGPNDVIIDDVFAQSSGSKNGKSHQVGDTITILNHPFRICGIVEHGKGGRKMLPIETLGQLIGSDGKASLFYLKSDNVANQDLIRTEIHNTPGLGDYQVQTMEEWLSLMTPEHIPGFNLSLNVVTSIAVIIGFLVIFQAMYTAVLERTREIGILKSLGASRTTILGVVLRETAVISVAGVLSGLAITFALHAFLEVKFPTFFFEVTQAWVIKASIIAFSGAILGALYPAVVAARKDPIDALAYE